MFVYFEYVCIMLDFMQYIINPNGQLVYNNEHPNEATNVVDHIYIMIWVDVQVIFSYLSV